ncbi:MAG TPA: YIP1 family protein [Acidimicrobiia bacterium]|nr:YIP1 family protein [Acidimicrobiia bacterium]
MFEAIAARLPRVLKLEEPVHREIAEDESATAQAIVVTILAALIASLTSEGSFVTNVVGAIIFAPIGLFVWTGISFLLGKMFGGTASYIALLRPIGYAAAPYALAIVPIIGQLAGAVYSAVIQVKAHQQVNGLSQGAAIAVVVIPLALLFIFAILLAILAGMALLAGLGGLADS